MRAFKVCDVHAHIYPDKVAEKAVAAIGGFYEGFTMHGRGTAEDLLRRMDTADVHVACIHSAAVTPAKVVKVNQFIFDTLRSNPARFFAFGAIHPQMEHMDDYLDELCNMYFKGLKIHPDMMRFNVDGDEAMPMMEAIAKNGRLPLLIHCGDARYDYDSPKRILNLHRRVPELKMICAHMGGWMVWEEAAELLPGNGLLVDCSSTLFRYEPEKAAEVIRRFGTKNVLFGTDYPMWDPTEELERFMKLPLTDEEREDILWNNIMRVIG